MAVIPSSILISQASNVFVSIPKADLGRTLGCDESSDFIADVYKQAQQSPGSPVLAAQVDVVRGGVALRVPSGRTRERHHAG